MDAPMAEEDGLTMADLLSSDSRYSADHKVEYDSMCSELMQVLSSVLNERERMIVVQSFGIGCPERGLDDIGSSMGLSRERVRQIRERGLDKIRKSNMSYILLRHAG
jgi:RNA polymerase primary sigma factor